MFWRLALPFRSLHTDSRQFYFHVGRECPVLWNCGVCLQESWGNWSCCRREYCTSALNSSLSVRSQHWAEPRESATCRRISSACVRLCGLSGNDLTTTGLGHGWTSISSVSVPTSVTRSFRHASDFFYRISSSYAHAAGSHVNYSLPRGRRRQFSR